MDAPLTGSFQSRPDVMSSRWRSRSAFLRASTLANERSGKKPSTGWSTLVSSPSLSAMATRLPITDLVAELIRCFIPGANGA
jgi:hypothetical protein